MRTILGLVSKGVPWDVVCAMSQHEREAFVIALGEMESGKEFNFDTGRWTE